MPTLSMFFGIIKKKMERERIGVKVGLDYTLIITFDNTEVKVFDM
jgi:hypothetical protein